MKLLSGTGHHTLYVTPMEAVNLIQSLATQINDRSGSHGHVCHLSVVKDCERGVLHVIVQPEQGFAADVDPLVEVARLKQELKTTEAELDQYRRWFDERNDKEDSK